MATINKYVTETTNISDNPININKKYNYIVETTDIFVTNNALIPKNVEENTNINEGIIVHKQVRPPLKTQMLLSDNIRAHIQHFILTKNQTKTYKILNSTYPEANFIENTLTSFLPNPVIKLPKPTITGVTPDIKTNYNTKISPIIFNPVLNNENNTIYSNIPTFEFRLGTLLKSYKVKITLTSTYDIPLTISKIKEDYGLGVFVDLPYGKTIKPKSSLSFYFTVDFVLGRQFGENYLYMFFDNGIMMKWKFCYYRPSSIVYYSKVIPPELIKNCKFIRFFKIQTALHNVYYSKVIQPEFFKNCKFISFPQVQTALHNVYTSSTEYCDRNPSVVKNAYFIKPDKNSYKENYSFFSRIFTSLTGAEDIVPLMDTPKLSFSANFSYRNPDEMDILQNLILKNEQKPIYFPIWSELTQISNLDNNNSNIINVKQISSYFKVNTKILLQHKNCDRSSIVLTITDIDTDKKQITVDTAVHYTLDTYIVPLTEVTLSQNSSSNYFNKKDKTISLSVRTLK